MTTVHFTYTPSLNVAVSSKGTVTLWTTGNPATLTKRIASLTMDEVKRVK